MNFFADPLAVGFIWRIGLLLFAWIVFWSLGREGANHDWWINLLQSVRIVPRPAEEEESAPLYTRTNTLVIGPAEAPKNEAEIIDYTPVIEKSRTVLKVLGSLMLLVTLFHGFVFYRRYDPYFLFGPRTSQIAGPGSRPALPPAIPGAGGAGVIVPATAGRPAGQPGNAGPSGSVGQPGSAIGVPEGAPPPNRSGLLPQTGGGGAIGAPMPPGGGAGFPPGSPPR